MLKSWNCCSGCKSYIGDASHILWMFLSFSVLVLFGLDHIWIYPLYHHLLLLLISSIFLLPSLGAVLFILCGFAPYFELLPLTTIYFSHQQCPKILLEFSNLSWSYKNIKFNPSFLSLLLFSQKSSVLSQLLGPLFWSQCHWFYCDVSSIPYFLSSGGGPCTHSHSLWPRVTRTRSWRLSRFAQRDYPYGSALRLTCMSSIHLANLGGQGYNFSSCIGNIPDCKEIFHFYFSLTYFCLSFMLSLRCSDQLSSPNDVPKFGNTG